MGLLINGFDIALQLLPQAVIFLHDGIVFLAIAPKLVGLTGIKIASAPVPVIQRGNVLGPAVAVHPQHRRIHRKLVPADQQLPEGWVVHVLCHKAADVRCPP